MYDIEYTNSFKKDYKRIQRREYDTSLLFGVIEQLMNAGQVEPIHKPHKLSGKYASLWECHIQPDWLLIWNINEKEKLISLINTGTHSDLF
jgi:addiction module toxin, RelE/StbE family